jgi:hypothetical protein
MFPSTKSQKSKALKSPLITVLGSRHPYRKKSSIIRKGLPYKIEKLYGS